MAAAIPCTVDGGYANSVAGDYSVVAGGLRNIGTGSDSVVPGGVDNSASRISSFAVGRQAKANHNGTFVWADSLSFTDFSSTDDDQFLIRARGGVSIGHNAPDAPLHVVGGTDVNLASGGTLVLGAVNGLNIAINSNEIQARNNNAAASALFLNAGGRNVFIGTATANARLRVVNATCDGSSWINSSDRNLKAGFEPVDAQRILEKVAALPLTPGITPTHPARGTLAPWRRISRPPSASAPMTKPSSSSPPPAWPSRRSKRSTRW